MGTYGGYSGLSPMVVVGFTPKGVRCSSTKSLHGISGRGGGVFAGERFVRSPSQIVLIETGDGTTLESRRPAGEEVTAAG